MSSRLVELGVTRKESEVLEALGEYLTNAEIASRLYISERTVESHVSSLLRKFHVANRHELARKARDVEAGEGQTARTLPSVMELAADSTPLVGRRSELDQLRELWTRARRGQVLVAVVTGEAGVGKTRLVAELALEVHQRGGTVLYGSCFESDETPFLPFVQAIDAAIGELEGAEPHLRLDDALRASNRAMRDRVSGDSTIEIVDARAERADVLVALRNHIVRLAFADPLLLVLEDLHWATATTRDAVRQLAGTSRPAPLLIVATSRDSPPDVSDDLSRLLGDLARLPSTARLDLGGLDLSDVRELIVGTGREVDALDAAQLRALTGGIPLLVHEALASRGPRLRVGTSVSGLLALRSQRLTDDDNRLLDLAAVIGAGFDADALAAAAGTSLLDVLDVLERGEAAGLIIHISRPPGRFAFVHPLFRSIRYDSLPGSRRVQLHRQVCRALEARPRDPRVLAELARHAFASAPLMDVSQAIDYCARAGERAVRTLAFEEGAVHYRRALELLELLQPADEALRCQIMVRLGAVLAWSWDHEGRQVLEEAARLARGLGSATLLADVVWALCPFRLTVGRYDPLVVSLAEEALDRLGPSPSANRARVLVVLAAHAQGFAPSRRQTLASEAIATARAADDPVALGEVLQWYDLAAWDPDNLTARVAATDELAQLADRLDNSIFGFESLSARHSHLVEVGDLTGARAGAAHLESLVGDRQDSFGRLGTLSRRVVHQTLAGELEAAELTAEQFVSHAGGSPMLADPMITYGAWLLVIRFHQGRIGELIPLIRTSDEATPSVVAYRAVLAMALARTGEHSDARALLRRLAHDGATAIPRHFQWFPAMICLADAAELTNTRDVANELARLLEPYSGRLAVHGGNVSIPVDIALAQLALVCGDNDRAAALAHGEAEASRRRETPIFRARALVLQAAAHPRARSRRHNGALVQEALDIGRRTGAGLIQQEVCRYQLDRLATQ